MVRDKIIKIIAFVLNMIMCVLFLLPTQYNLSAIVFNPEVEAVSSASPGRNPEVTDNPEILPTTSLEPVDSSAPQTTVSAGAAPTPAASPSYYEKHTTPYVGTGTTPKYTRESHHYSVSIKFPDTYRVENTLYFKVVLNAQLIHVYRRDSQGNPTELVRSMIMSSGVDKNSSVTPLGKFMLMDNSLISTAKSRWMHFTNEWAQYTTRLFYITESSATGMEGYSTGFLFHSELYREADPTRLIVDEYNTLGYPRSHGCMRLQVKDAKWIYDNARAGSVVEIIDGTADPATWAALKPALLPAGTDYDPTDPAKPGVSSEPKLYFNTVTAAPTVKPAATPTRKPTATPEVTPTATPVITPVVTPVATPEVTPTDEPVITPGPTVIPESENP